MLNSESHKIRVALVGNMNNNFFVLMRYLRDLGIDAHLFLFSNEKSHFLPENDTWFIEKWERFIHTMNFPSNYHSVKAFNDEIWNLYFENYDVVIGSGITPAIFARVNKQLDIFKCYGADFYDLPFYKPFWHGGLISTVKANLERFIGSGYQKKGLKETKYVFIFNSNKIMLETERKLGLDNVSKVSVPMVYNEEIKEIDWPKELSNHLELVSKSDFLVMSHSRQVWKTLDNPASIKRNDILIEGFALFLKETNFRDPKLILFEHGIDVEESKKYVRELGIEDNVIWFPLIARKFLSVLIDKCNFGADQFHLGVWGGTTNEYLAKGKPLLNKISVDKTAYESKTGTKFPPILNAQTPQEVKHIFSDYERNVEKYNKIGNDSKLWFEEFMGISLAEKYVEIISEIFSKKNKN